MPPLPQFQELNVISDLHMGGEKRLDKNFQIFKQGDVLGKLITGLGKKKNGQIGLVINGDMVDFLAEPNPKYFDPDGAIEKLDRISKDDSFRPVWDALRFFVAQPDRQLIITLGHHDLELSLPWVREHLLQMLAANEEQRRRITLAFDGCGFLAQVGSAKVLCVHGNDVDDWNVTDYDRMRRIVRDRQFGQPFDNWIPNAGTQLVIDVMNEIKREFPFVDLLKPEMEAVVPTLLALDPKSKPKIKEIWDIFCRITQDKKRRQQGLLSADDSPVEVTPAPDFDDMLRRTFRTSEPPDSAEDLLKKARANREDKVQSGQIRRRDEQGQTLGITGAIWNWVTGKTPAEVLREALEGLKKDQSFDPKQPEDTLKQLDKLISDDIPFITAGHTHLERALIRPSGRGYYFNSGTWVRLMRLTPDVLDSPAVFEEVFKTIKRGTLESLENSNPKLVELKPAVVHIEQTTDAVVGSLRRVDDQGNMKDADSNLTFSVPA